MFLFLFRIFLFFIFLDFFHTLRSIAHSGIRIFVTRRGEEELGILVVGCVMCMAVHITHSCEMSPCISQILSSPFSSKKGSWNIWSLALGYLMRHSTCPQTSHCLHCSQIVTGDDYGKLSLNIYWKWNWTQQILSEIMRLLENGGRGKNWVQIPNWQLYIGIAAKFCSALQWFSGWGVAGYIRVTEPRCEYQFESVV